MLPSYIYHSRDNVIYPAHISEFFQEGPIRSGPTHRSMHGAQVYPFSRGFLSYPSDWYVPLTPVIRLYGLGRGPMLFQGTERRSSMTMCYRNRTRTLPVMSLVSLHHDMERSRLQSVEYRVLSS